MSTTALASATTAPRLRLTRRGRIVFGTLLAAPLALVLTISAFSSAPAQAGSTASSATFEYVTVASGESLWELAEWIAPESDPRDVISAIVSLNQLATTDVHPGQRLAVPASYSS
ncbi:LysM peptidoglycan-binding domain-containing protein [Salinibacterium sp. ZJ70]|uniref:LysM peptidoglycan-binding domain-containing protein n=1 Tax=Salinibacterium sp. ZJ70 TaxID=2708084 RepID=UPI00142265F1|nr:LysM peptidoglycan-binding domain-containing protein [Salinibacterium sp. ZJ70]